MAPQDDYGPTVLAVIWSQIGLASCFLSLRLYCKFRKHSGLWWDDYVLIASWTCLLISVALTTYIISLGFGKHIYVVPPMNLPMISLTGNIITTTSITAAVWSKTSFAMTLLRIKEQGWTRYVIWAAIISMNVLMGLNALASWVQCTPIEKFWMRQTPGSCWDPRVATYYDIFASGYSALMDILLAMLPWPMILGLQMKIQEKIGVGIAMSMGLLAGSTAIIKCTTLPSLLSGDFTYDGGQLAIWGTCETSVTIMAASIPVLRVLVRDVASSARRYYGSSGSRTVKSRIGHGPSPRRTNTVTITTSPQKGSFRRKWDRLADDRSDKSTVGAELDIDFGKIIRTNEIVVQYDTRSEIEGRNNDYELHQMGPKNPSNMV
ncbi:hypothetical protein CGRA01v4_13362 [Colletotrichum graminicola]|uniref:Rhodopsin domain-containing protein n=1 Tax=Colletotrichum graminicola (strain M1.001 / M2 / FGSC 10212) TaxID=645133 RepID=E3QWV4_COLGM|nr:uncharacterized protein GLRG_10486 [Colletotrichum graminicola M1.001]EFQ35342.1 hypothetical protein GLRG_10486 [Colletotrichum graminicola M1.001]WDK22072.1 hypothetical protein CGRA01v4_13362 [Colletotrichum graminicola]